MQRRRRTHSLAFDIDLALQSVEYVCSDASSGGGQPCTFSNGAARKTVYFPTIAGRFSSARGPVVLEEFEVRYSAPVPERVRTLDVESSGRSRILGDLNIEISTMGPAELTRHSGIRTRLRQALYSLCRSPAMLLPNRFTSDLEMESWAVEELGVLARTNPRAVSRQIGYLLAGESGVLWAAGSGDRRTAASLLEKTGVPEAAELLLIASGSDPQDPFEKLITIDNIAALDTTTIAPYLARSRDRYYRELYVAMSFE
jgi:hypothetical protein